MKFNTPYNFTFDGSVHATTPEGDSLTVPDMHITVRDMLNRYVQGGQLPRSTSAYYDDTADFDDAHDMDRDLVDIAENAANIAELRSKLKNEARKQKLDKQSDSKTVDDSSKNSEE